MRKYLPFLVLLVVLAAGLMAYNFNQGKPLPGWTAENSPGKAPDFTLAGLAGEDISLSDFNGQVVLVSFWTTWCPYCKENMPVMESLYGKYGEDGLAVLAVNVAAFEKTGDAAEEFIRETGYSFPVLLDQSGDVYREYRVAGFPTSFIINRQGEIAYSKAGGFTLAEIEAMVNKAKHGDGSPASFGP